MRRPRGRPPLVIMSLAPGDLLGHYRILSHLGSGGMGQVFLAEDTSLRRQVAIKLLPPEMLKDDERRRRFLREARAAAAVDHPNVIHIYEVNEDPSGSVYLVMQHVEGKTLRQLLGSGRLEAARVIDLAAEVADALAAAHAKGIVHRDVKPDNIMIDAAGHARLLDFGLARALEEEPAGDSGSELQTVAAHATSPGVVMGTIAYMSPEQARGDAVDARSDIFSFGVTLYETLSGRHPFAGRTSIETADSLLHAEPKPIGEITTGVPPETGWVLTKMLAKDRDDRYQSAREVLADLKRLKQGSTSSGIAPPAAAPRGASRGALRGRRRLFIAAAAAVAVLVAIPAGIAIWRATHPAESPGNLFKIGDLEIKIPAPPGGKKGQGEGGTTIAFPGMKVQGVTIPPIAIRARGGAEAAEPTRLAVLPFQNVRRDMRIDYLGLALADAIISKLAYVQAVSVRPSSYVAKYKDAPPDPKKAGEDLAVDHLLTGSLIAAGDDLRVSVQLVDLENDSIQWQDTFDARLDKLLTLQDEVVTRVVSGLRIKLSEAEATNLQRDVPRDPEAYRLVLQSLALPETREGAERAVVLLKESLKRDPGFAPAWAGLAGRQYDLGLYGGAARDAYKESEKNCRKALELNPDLPLALREMTVMLTESGRHEEAYQLARRWLKVSPSDAEAHFSLSYLFRYTGLLDEAAAEGDQAMALNEHNPRFRSLALLYEYIGDYARARDLTDLDSGSSYSLYNRGRMEVHLGDAAAARADFEKCREADPNSGTARLSEGTLKTLEGDRAGALAIFSREADAIAPDPEMYFNLAKEFAEAGDPGKAIFLLDRAVAGGFYSYPAFQKDSLLDSLRKRPDFIGILEKARLKHEAFKRFVEANP